MKKNETVDINMGSSIVRLPKHPELVKDKYVACSDMLLGVNYALDYSE